MCALGRRNMREREVYAPLQSLKNTNKTIEVISGVITSPSIRKEMDREGAMGPSSQLTKP
jgi:hypothetical protein